MTCTLGSLQTAEGGLVTGVMVYVYAQSRPKDNLHQVSRWIGCGADEVGNDEFDTGFRPPN